MLAWVYAFIDKLITPVTFIVGLAAILVFGGFLFYHWLVEPPSTELDAGSFVGGAGPGAKALIAVVASSAEEGEGEREVTAYLCDGAEISEWFEGEAGNKLDITSEGKAHLEGSLTPEIATGTISQEGTYDLLDLRRNGRRHARPITFTAPRAYGVSGLYNVSILSDGSFSGSSETGGRIKGQIAKEETSEGEHAVTITITPSDGQPIDLDPDNVIVKNFSAGDARLVVSDTRLVGFGNEGLDGDFTIMSKGCICTDSSDRCIECKDALSA